MIQIAVLISGNGSNLQMLINNEKAGILKAHIAIVISDNAEAFGLKRAEREGIKNQVINYNNFNSIEDAESEINKILYKNNIEMIVSAGFLREYSSSFVNKWFLKLINLHPSLLPSFACENAIEHAFNEGVRITGVSTRFVEKGIETGLIILQSPVKIDFDDDLTSLTEKIHNLEYKLLSETINIVASNKFNIIGRKVLIN